MIFDQVITIVRPSWMRDRYGDDVADWAHAQHTTVTGVSMQPAAQAEDVTSAARVMVTTGYKLHTRGDVDLRSEDRVLYDDVELEVVGEVARWPHPIHPRRIHHVEAFLERRSG